MQRLMRVGIVVLVLLMTGCIEEKTTVTVYKTGAGTIHLNQKINKKTTDLMFSFEKGDAAKNTAAEKFMYKELAKWQGVIAWSKPMHSLKDGALIIEATGFFDNVSQLKYADDDGKNTQSFAWVKINDGRFRLSWVNQNSSEKKDILGEYDTEDKVNMTKNMMGEFKGLRVEREVVLPGDVEDCRGCTVHAGRSASSVITDKEYTQFFNLILDYRQQVAVGTLTKDEANARLLERRAELSGNLATTCRPVNAGQEFAQFQMAFEKAKADYADSGIDEKIKAALAKKPH
jgi:hypothetical protein